MAENSLLISVKAELSQVKKADEALAALKTAYKTLDYEIRRGNATAQDRLKLDRLAVDALIKHEKDLKKFTAAVTDLGAVSYQVGQRAKNSFESLSGSLSNLKSVGNSASKELHALTQASNRSQQGFVALAYIIQDLPYGIRGVANNITQLSQVLGTPIWLNIAISGLTSLAVVFSDRLKNSIVSANAELDRFNAKSTQAGRAFSSYGFGLEARGKYQIGGFSATKLKSEKGYYVTQADYVQSQIVMYEGLRDAILDKESATDEEQKKVKAYDKNIANLNTQLSAQLSYISAINEEEERRFKIREKPRKQLVFGAYGTIGQSRSEYAFAFDKPYGAGGELLGDYNTRRAMQPFKWRPTPIKVPDIKSSQEYSDEWMREQLQDSVATFNSVFFDPVRAGFRAISDEIRQGLFGSLDDLKAKFGNVGAAIVQSLTQVITKLIEVGLSAAILSFLFPGAGGFSSIFKSIIMPGSLVTQKHADGGWVHEPVYGVGKSGKSYLFGENGSEYVMNNRMANNMMLGGRGTQTIRVEVVGKYRGGDIYLANKNAEALLSAIKL